MTIQEILEAHTLEWVADDVGNYECACGFYPDPFNGTDVSIDNQHRAHVAEVLDKHMQEQCSEAKAEAYKDAERILHEEARWQLDLHQRHKEYRFKHCSERMTEMENCMTVRANQYKETQ